MTEECTHENFDNERGGEEKGRSSVFASQFLGEKLNSRGDMDAAHRGPAIRTRFLLLAFLTRTFSWSVDDGGKDKKKTNHSIIYYVTNLHGHSLHV